MPISLHAALIPSFEQMLGGVAGVLDKGTAFCAERERDPDSLIGAKLANDMLPFGYQVKSCVAHSVGAIEGVRKGVFSPDMTPWPDSMDGLRAAVAGARATLAALDPGELDGFIGRDMRFTMGSFELAFTAESFLLSFSQPNFYFHATTAYDILRAEGVPLGKRDYLGVPRAKAA